MAPAAAELAHSGRVKWRRAVVLRVIFETENLGENRNCKIVDSERTERTKPSGAKEAKRAARSRVQRANGGLPGPP